MTSVNKNFASLCKMILTSPYKNVTSATSLCKNTTSEYGIYGAMYDGQVASRDWNVQVSFLSSNERKMLAILMALKACSSLIRGKNIQLLPDNISVMAYVNHKGGGAQLFQS